MHISSNVSPSNLSHGVAPISSKLGASLASWSRVVPGRGNSSWSRATEPSSLTIVMTLLSKRPSAIALAARSWDDTASSSQSVREKPSTVAMRSAEMPCGISGYFWRTSGLSPSIVPGTPS
jgi:hypothetical protein